MKKWNAEEYQTGFNFVSLYGENVLELIDIKENMRVLDLGCGNGLLTKKLKGLVSEVVGVDQSTEMITLAKKNNPDIMFYQMDAKNLQFREEFDLVFSNAVLHWIDDQDMVIKGIYNALKQNGQFVCEFGGYGCGALVHEALNDSFNKRGLNYHIPFYFPTIGEYAPILERNGLSTCYAVLFDRPTKLNENQSVIDWINMFVTKHFEGINIDIKNEILEEVYKKLEPILVKNGFWYIDYVRIRLKAIKR